MRRAIIVVAAALLAGHALADDLEARVGRDIFRLHDAPCMDAPVLAYIPLQHQAEFQSADALVDGHVYLACWRKAGAMAHLIYDDGDQGLVPANLLQRKPDT